MTREDAPGISFHDLSAGGQVGELIRKKDWAATPLGPKGSWPRSLNNHLSMIFELPTAAIIFWGPDQIQLYNDGYSVIMGPRHPQHLGSTFRECWPEAYPAINPWMQRVLKNGETVEVNRTLVPLTRFGFTEEAYFTFSFSPLRDDEGKIAGVLQLVTEVTGAVLGERRATALRELSNQTAHAKTAGDATRLASEALAKHAADLPFSLIYVVDPVDSQRMILSGSTGLPQDRQPFPSHVDLRPDAVAGIPELSRAVLERTPVPLENLATRFGLPAGAWPEPAALALASPIAAADQQSIVALLVAGISPRLAFDGHYRGFLQLVTSQLATLMAAARAYDDERKRADALAEVDRAKTEFFSNVSHEFRTPLTLMLGPLEDELAEKEPPLPGERLDRLKAVHRNSLRLLKMVNALLEFSRIEAGRAQASYEPTDLAKFTAELASSFRSAMDRAGLEFTIDCPALPDPVYVDHEMWEKIVLNLISNAFKHTFKGGIRVRIRPAGEFVELVVADTGVGISATDQGRLFERFHRVTGAQSRSHEGSGIGLALVKELASLHGGTVTLESRLGQGSTFTVRVKTGQAHLPPNRVVPARAHESSWAGASGYVEEALRWLPASQDAPSGPAAVAGSATLALSAPGEGPGEPRPRILLADDNADMRDYVGRLLAGRYEVRAVPDGASALQAAREEPRPELILSDVMMPRLDGFGLLRELRADAGTKAIPVILLSARAGEESSVEGLDSGADDYIVKPFSARELLARVRTHLEIARIRRESALELERANQELEAFSYSVSHDLRAPLRAIDGFSKMLLQDHAEKLDSEGRRLLGTVLRGAERMARLIDDLLEFSRLGRKALRKTSFDPAAMARDVLGELLAGAPHRKVEVSVGSLPRAWGDPALLKQVFVNLLSNALKYTRPREVARIEVGGSSSAKEHTYWVKDNGVGYDPEYAHKLFRVFQRLHSEREFEGTGVGLALVQRIVERHGGRVWAEGAPDQGATFTFSLPFEEGPAPGDA